MIRWLTFGIVSLLSTGVLLAASAAPAPQMAQAPTPDAIGLTGTALVSGATQTAAFGPSATPSGGTATPLAGLCNSLSFRVLDDVNADVIAALTETELTLIESEVTALEDTEDCITFDLRETEAVIRLATLTIDDEAQLGDDLAGVLAAVETTTFSTLPDAVLEVEFVQGNQRRGVRVAFSPAMALLQTEDAPTGADLLNALTWLE